MLNPKTPVGKVSIDALIEDLLPQFVLFDPFEPPAKIRSVLQEAPPMKGLKESALNGCFTFSEVVWLLANM